jgi:HEAT repeat protein
MALAPVLLALALAAPRPPADRPPASDAVAPAPAEVHERVSAWLGAIHAPVSPDAFRALGPSAEDALAGFARSDPSPVRRLRALEALAGLGGARAEGVHREVLASPSAPTAVRRGAARGLGRLLAPAAAADTLGPVLERDHDPAVRAAAAEALGRASPADGCARVRAQARLDAERARFQRALDACDRPGQAGPPSR